QKQPQIDLVAGVTSSGIGGVLNPGFDSPFCNSSPDPATCRAEQLQAINGFLNSSIGGPGSTYPDVFAGKYPTYRVGITFNLPLFGDKTAGANYGKALVEGERIETQRAQLEQLIQVDVRNALQSLRMAEAKLRAAAIARENSVKQYESEQRKLDAGQSDV